MFTKLILFILVIAVLTYFSKFISLIVCAVLTYRIAKDLNNCDRVFYIQNIWSVLSPFIYVTKKIFSWSRSLFSSKKSNIKSNNFTHYHCGETACLEQEIDVIVLNVAQYYLHSWYDKVGDDIEFILLLNTLIKNTIRSLCAKITKLNGKEVSSAFLQVYFHYFVHFLKLKQTENFNPDDFDMKHWALQDNITEWCYLQSCVSCLIDTFAPRGSQDSLYSKHRPLLHNFIVEILTEHILQPLSNLLTDPIHLNAWLQKILEQCVELDKSSLIELESESEIFSDPSPQIFLETADSDYSLSDENQENLDQFLNVPNQTSAEYERNFDSGQKSNAFAYVPAFLSSGVKSSSNINLLDSEFSRVRDCYSDTCSSVLCDNMTIKRSKSADYIRQMPQLRALNMKDYNIMQSENNRMLVVLKSDSSSNNSIEQAEEAVELEVPTLFSDIKITDTIQENEVGLVPYTLYCIQYSGIFHDAGKASDVPILVKQEVNIRRRFREFLELQSRLQENPTLKYYLKGIKGPSKGLVLPFSNLDKKNIAERRCFLENYLKELCNQGPIAQSLELQEFLAYGGDATAAFVKKVNDINVPRIDKMLVRGVKGAIDMFRTALPNPAVEGGCTLENSHLLLKSGFEESISVHKFPEHLLEFSSRDPEMRSYLEKYLKHSNSTMHYPIDPAISLEEYLQKISLNRCLYKLKVDNSCGCSIFSDLKDQNLENAFGNTVVDLILESLKSSHINNALLFSIIKALLSPEIERYASVLSECSEDHLVIFLHALHKVLWPDESDESMTESTNSIKTACSNYAKLKSYLKVYLHQSNFLMRFSWIQNLTLEILYLFLSSIQQQQLNRYLLFYIFDIIIDIMCSKEN